MLRKAREAGGEADVAQAVVAGGAVADVDALRPRAGSWGVPHEAGEDDELVKGADGRVAVASKVNAAERPAEKVDDAEVLWDVLARLFGPARI